MIVASALQCRFSDFSPWYSVPLRLRGRFTLVAAQSQGPVANCQLLATMLHMTFRASASGFSKKTKTPPPEETGMESAYLKALGEKQTPVMVKLLSGESFRGWIEYYDLAMIRLTRENAPNLFIFKHEIMYIAEDNGRRSRS
jgi:host factor-I protein